MVPQDKPKRLQPSIDLGYPTLAHGKIPAFNSIEDEADFWDTHSFVDYLDEFERVDVHWVKRSSQPLSVRLDSTDRAELSMLAKQQGVGSSTLVRTWIKERLERERQAS
jgi:hypothetical protein